MKITRRRAILAAAATPIAAAIPVPAPASTLIEFVPALWKFTPLVDCDHGLAYYGQSLSAGYYGPVRVSVEPCYEDLLFGSGPKSHGPMLIEERDDGAGGTDMNDRYILVDKVVTPASPAERERFFGGIGNHPVAATHFGDVRVSTVFLKYDQCHNGAPLAFQTIVFGLEDDHEARCATWAEAETQHAGVCKAVGIPYPAHRFERS